MVHPIWSCGSQDMNCWSWKNKTALSWKSVFDYEFGNLWYNGILTYLWVELRGIILMEMIMYEFRGIMWNFSLSGVRKALNYARKSWYSKQVYKENHAFIWVMHVRSYERTRNELWTNVTLSI